VQDREKIIETAIDINEPKRVSQTIKKLGLSYSVITSVTRGDLDDGGASIFVKIVEEIHKTIPECKIELLIPDLKGNWKAPKSIVDAKPNVINHNVEVVEELFPEVRPRGSYDTSLELLKKIKEYDSKMITKSGMMIGLGETREQIIKTMEDLRKVNCEMITIGQYLQPSPGHAEIKKFYNPEEFVELKEIGESSGFNCVESRPLVRSSFKANECYQKGILKCKRQMHLL